MMSPVPCTRAECENRSSGPWKWPRFVPGLGLGLFGLLSCASGDGANADVDAAAADVPIVRELSMKVNGEPWIATRIATFATTSSRFGGSISVSGARDGGPEEIHIGLLHRTMNGKGLVGTHELPPPYAKNEVQATGAITLVRPGERYSSAPGDPVNDPDGTTIPRTSKFQVTVTSFRTAFKDIAIEATFSGVFYAPMATEPSLVITEGKISYSNRTGKPDPKN